MSELERLLARAERLIQNEQVDEGMDLLNGLLFDEPGSAALHNHLGWGYLYFVNDEDRARLHFEAAVRFDPGFAPPYLHMGSLMGNKGRYTLALEWFERGMTRTGANRLALAEGMAMAHEMRGEYSLAIRRYKEALSASTSFEFRGLRESIRRCRAKRWILLLDRAVRKKGLMNQILFVVVRALGPTLAWYWFARG